MTPVLFGAAINVGDHITRKFLGLTINVDTVISTLVLVPER